MKADLSTSRIYTDFQGLSDLRLAASQHSEEALKEVAGQFEAVFIQMMLKSMRDASLSDGIFDSQQSEMYMGMFDQQIALDLSVKGAFGIAEMMVRQLQNNQAGSSEFEADPVDTKNIHSGTSDNKIERDTMPEFTSPQSFIDYMLPKAQAAADKLGVSAQLLVAQAALETGWGKKIIKDGNNVSSHNLFGIKADSRWTGGQANVSTMEYRDGVVQREQASFRSYDSFQESFDDYVNFVQDGARYQQALDHDGNSHHYIEGLQRAGYATDPKYAEKVMNIMKRDFG